MAVDPRKVKALTKAVTKLGHEVRKDENSDGKKVKAARDAFKSTLANTSKEEQAEAWKIVGRPPKS